MSEQRNTSEVTDSRRHDFRFGEGGVPWFLLLGYLSFLIFFTWYVLTYQVTDFVKHGSLGPAAAEQGEE